MLPEMNNKELDSLAAEFRYLLVKLICGVVKWGHLGGTLSLTADDVANLGRDTLRDELKFNTEAGFIDVNEPDPEFIRTEPLFPGGGVFGVPAEEMARIWDDLDTIAIF
jgi:hypothetical protein